MNNKFYEIFQKASIIGGKINNLKIKNKLQVHRNAEIIGNTRLIPLHNGSSPMPVD